MNAVVLAGGYATRLWPITRYRPKMLLPVGDVAVIDLIFTELEADDRIDDVYVSTNEQFVEAFQKHLADSPFEKPQLSVEESSEEAEKFGVVGALDQLVEREGIEDDMLVIAGDNLISFDVGEFIDFFEKRASPTIAAYDVKSVDRARSYGIVELDGDRVVDFEEKPENPRSTLASIACYGFPAETLDDFGRYLEGGNNPDEPGWFVQWLVENEPVYAFTFDGAWFDIGTPDSYLDAIAWHLDGESYVAESAIVENSTIGSNVHVMEGAQVYDSRIDESVIFPNATVRSCAVRDSIIDEDTHIEGIDLAGALIGAHTRIANGQPNMPY